MHELRLAARALGRHRAFTSATILTLALAIGATSALFGVFNALLLRPLPGVETTGLVNLYVTRSGELEGLSGFSYPTFRDLQERVGASAAIEAFAGRGLALGDEAGAAIVGGQLVTGGFFDLLGTRAARGRLLTAEDDKPGAPRVAVISHALWQQRLAGTSDVIGRAVRLNGRVFTLVGICEEGFRGHFVGFPFDVYLPLAAAPEVAVDVQLGDRAGDGLELIGRLRPGIDGAAAQAQLTATATDLAHDYPSSHRGLGISLSPHTGFDADLRGSVLGFVALLAVVAALILLVACVNVGGLILARGAIRERELAVRTALGASQLAVARPLVVEIVLLFAAGGGLGAALAPFAANLLHRFLPEFPIPIHLDLAPDWRVALFAAGMTLLAALGFGLVPALNAARVDVVEALKQSGRGLAGGRQRGRRIFVGAQVALSFTLLVGAGLFLRELEGARRSDPGFRTDGIGLLTVDVSFVGRSPAAGREFFETWLERVRAHPEVDAASLVRTPPLGFGQPTIRVLADGVEPPSPEGFSAGSNVVAPGYFQTLGIPLLSGRDFADGDAHGRERVAIVSRATASRLFPGQEAVGLQLRIGEQELRVVGVAGDIASDRKSAKDGIFIYVPFRQTEETRMSIVLHGRGGRAALPLDEVRQQAQALDADLPVLAAKTLREHAARALFPQRLAASVTTAFGGFGLVLAGVGIYGVVSFLAERRRNELAVRAALGASSGALLRLVLVQGLTPVAVGLLAGLGGALLLGRLAAGFLLAVSPFDPVALGAAALVLGLVSVMAAGLPARRAAAARPMDLMRSE